MSYHHIKTGCTIAFRFFISLATYLFAFFEGAKIPFINARLHKKPQKPHEKEKKQGNVWWVR